MLLPILKPLLFVFTISRIKLSAESHIFENILTNIVKCQQKKNPCEDISVDPHYSKHPHKNVYINISVLCMWMKRKFTRCLQPKTGLYSYSTLWRMWSVADFSHIFHGCHFINNKWRSLADTHTQTAQVFRASVTLNLHFKEVSERDNEKWELLCPNIKHTQSPLIVW